MATGIRSASSIMNMLKYQPIKQKQLAEGVNQEGRDNRAVSQQDSMLGKQVAGEQSRLHALDEFGADLATRKDKLLFSKKLSDEQNSMAQQRMAINEDNFGTRKMFDYAEGALGLASVGVNYMGMRRKREKDAKIVADNKEMQASLKDFLGIKRKALIGRTIERSNVLGISDPDSELDMGY